GAATTLWMDTNQYPDDPAYSRFVTRSLKKTGSPAAKGEPETERVGTALMRIEDVAIEKHLVATPAGKVEKTCLVVRVSHEPKKPVFVQLRQQAGERALGEMHLYYSGANKVNRYTA